MSKKSNSTYHIQAKITLTVSVPVKAASLEEALAQAKECDEHVFVKTLGELIDYDFELQGVYK